MNKIELIEAVQKQLGSDISKAEAEKAITAVIHSIRVGAKRDKMVQLVGLGSFKVVDRKARRGIGPPLQQIRFSKTISSPKTGSEHGVVFEMEKELTELIAKSPHRSVVTKALETTAQGVKLSLAKEKDVSESTVLLSVVDEFGRLLERELGEKFSVDYSFALARIRGETAKLEILDESGPMLTLQQAAELLGVTKQAVHKRLQNGSLFGMKYKEEIRIPAWQIRDGEVVPGISKVLKKLDTTDWGKMLFFHSENLQLAGRRPKDLILEGRVDAVADLAALFGEQGAK
jgi:DNA-binding protein HU-beta